MQDENDDSEDFQLLFNRTSFVLASQLNSLEFEKNVCSLSHFINHTITNIFLQEKAQKKKAAALKSLSEWTHINCLYPSAVDAVQDEILSQLIALTFEDDDGNEGETDQDTEPKKAVIENLHDGAVTFLFEKRSESKIDESDE